PGERRPLRRIAQVETAEVLRLRDPKRPARIPERLLQALQVVPRRHRLRPLLRRGVAEGENSRTISQVCVSVILARERENLVRERAAKHLQMTLKVEKGRHISEGG